MSLRLQVIPRNYELEELLYSQKAKMKPTKDNLLKAADEESQSYQIAAQKFEPKIEAVEEDEDAGGIRDKARAFDPLADFRQMDNAALDFESWEAKKLKIFAMFQGLTDDLDVMIDERRDKNIDRPIKYGQGKSRLEMLNLKPGQTSNTPTGTMYSAKEFTSQLERINKELVKFWEKEDKVASIRIGIQCAKLLNDVATPMFYPQKFILLTDILDTFGELVHQRMIKLTKEHSKGRILITAENEDQIDFSQLPEKVIETCRNWFLKSACIREVLPRIYLELALVSSIKYAQMRVQQSDLMRLSKMVRGIAEPLCASYTCAYLARVGHTMDPNAKDYLHLLVDFMFKIYNQSFVKGHPTVEKTQYLSLFDPTVDWLMQCLAYQADRSVFKEVWGMYSSNPKHAVFLKCIIRYFPSEIISVAVGVIQGSIKTDYAGKVDEQLVLIKELGLALLRCPPKKSQLKLELINFGWETMGKTNNADRYMDCSIVLIEFSIKSLNQGSVQIFIKEIFKRFQDFALSMSSDDSLFRKLEFLLVKVMTAGDFSELIGFENLLGLLNYFPTQMKHQLCEKMLSHFCEQQQTLDDGFLINSILQVAKTLHDKIDFMSQQSEVDKVSKIICKIIRRIDHGKDLDKTLNDYTNARGMFVNLDEVTETLIYSTLQLASRCHALCKGQHNGKTQNFVKACVAYCHITIPTLMSVPKQVNLLFVSAQVALLNGLIGEVESLIGMIIEILEVNHKDELPHLIYTSDCINRILGMMVVVPSNPEDQFFILVEGMLQLMKGDNTWTADKGAKLQCEVYLNVVRFLASQTQERLPYRIPFVNSNDQIFQGNQEFETETNRLMDYCFAMVLEQITTMNEQKNVYAADLFRLSISCANLLIGVGNTGTKQIASYINKMFKMADGYMTDYNNTLPATAGPNEKLSRTLINKSFDVFKKKKDGLAQKATTRASAV